jgi:ATP-binding cassette subfamily F protein 3
MDKTIFDEIQDDYPYLNNTKVRNVLAAFLFRGDDVYKRIGDLSGGEQGRVSLAKLMLSNANFLILDEPTNHLDIQGREVLEDAINQYEGTVLYVSHDRYFINRTATRILELFENRFDNYIGNYDYYLSKKDDVRRYGGSVLDANASSQRKRESSIPNPELKSSQKTDWELQKEYKKELQKLERDLKSIEQEIQKLEARNQELDDEYQNPDIAADVGKLMQLHKEHEANDDRLSDLYESWESTSERLEELRQQDPSQSE